MIFIILRSLWVREAFGDLLTARILEHFTTSRGFENKTQISFGLSVALKIRRPAHSSVASDTVG